MNITPVPRATSTGFVLAFAMPLLVTAAVVTAVSANRSGGREPIELTNREVIFVPGDDENSAATLWLSWQGPLSTRETWLDREKLATLGFDVSVDPASSVAPDHYRRLLPRERHVAFELDGPAWQAFLAVNEPEEASANIDRGVGLRASGSRLMAVDADADGEALSAKYPNSRTHLIGAGRISVQRTDPRGGPAYVIGAITDINPRRIYVPREFASSLPPRAVVYGTAPPFTVSIRYGRRFEPWVVDVSKK